MAHGQAFLPREGPLEMTGSECGELIEEEVEEAWWLGNLARRMEMGKVMLFWSSLPAAAEYQYVRTLVVKPFFIMISVSDTSASKSWDHI